MAITPFLAMTAGEIAGNTRIPEQIAWMACHFSPFGPGLSNLPQSLPEGSLLMVDDSTPLCGHDPQLICSQLCDCVNTLACSGVVLDFQRPGIEETSALVKFLTERLPCPVAVSHFYAGAGPFPVLLPPVPPSEPPEAYFAPWKGREIWLELALDAAEITVTEEGSVFQPLPFAQIEEPMFFDETLLCRYHSEISSDSVRFTLQRKAEDLEPLLAKAENFGVTQAVGLFQELYSHQ